MAKLYQSKQWLKYQHHQKKLSVDEIAALCKVHPTTIRRQMERFAIRVVK